MPDRARQKTDKRLNAMERKIGRMYKMHPALIAIKKEYNDYMKMVDERTKKSYNDYIKEKDEEVKKEKKKKYTDEVKALTLESARYKRIINRFTDVMAQVNQDALDIVNEEMILIYVDNYNQVAVECKKVGIEVNGEEE